MTQPARKLKVLLVVPAYKYKEAYPTFLSASDFPAGFAYVAAALREAGHQVVGLNLNNKPRYNTAYNMVMNEVYQAIEETQPDLIGVGGLCIDYACIKDTMEVIRKFSKTPIVLGGNIVSKDRDFIFTLLKPDYCVVGEAEETAVKLANMLSLRGRKRLNTIENLGYWENDKPVFTPVNYNYDDINRIPFPAYDVFGMQDMVDNYSMATRLLYRYPRAYPRPMGIVTARACPFNCTFCIHSGGPKYRARSIENIMAEIKEMYDRYHFNILIISDELFAVNKERMKEFCEAILENKKQYGWDFDWMFQTHANARLDKEMLELAKKAGCYFFSYGIESASPKVLKSMNKHIKPEQIAEAIHLAEEVGIGFGGNLLFGDPVETEETIYETLDFYAKHCQTTEVFWSYLQPYPGSKLFDYCVETGRIQDKKDYYESIGEVTYNMTTMPNSLFGQWLTFLSLLEQSWMMIKDTHALDIQDDTSDDAITKWNGHKMHKITAQCPYCGADLTYREIWATQQPMFLGTGCQKCRRRIKVMLPKPQIEVWGKPKEAVVGN